ncbi:MAG: LuxR C-terminal-related transcriptional regulator [Rikenellaceae bacterium]
MRIIGNIEFYNFESEVWYRRDSIASQFIESDKEITKLIIDKMTEFYPKSLKALQKVYASSSANHSYYLYRIAHRFCRCNFGEIDNRPDMDHTGAMCLERVSCPMRGECALENIVCNPEFNKKISDGEMRVARLLYNGLSTTEIADGLCLSEHTVRNHIRNAQSRLGVHSKAELTKYLAENNLITEDYE